jgi:hypothetical protein
LKSSRDDEEAARLDEVFVAAIDAGTTAGLAFDGAASRSPKRSTAVALDAPAPPSRFLSGDGGRNGFHFAPPPPMFNFGVEANDASSGASKVPGRAVVIVAATDAPLRGESSSSTDRDDGLDRAPNPPSCDINRPPVVPPLANDPSPNPVIRPPDLATPPSPIIPATRPSPRVPS